MQDIQISVRNLVEFIMQSGDITVSSTGLKDADAMQEGTRIHKKLQKRMGADYQAEVPLKMEIPVSYDHIDFTVTLEGRADGIFSDEKGQIVDEIKGVYRDIYSLEEAIPVHRAQALCYAYIYAVREQLPGMGIRMTYCHIPTEEVRYFKEYLDFSEIESTFFSLITEYAKWAAWQIHWQETRNTSIQSVDFPFSYRPGQKKTGERGVSEHPAEKTPVHPGSHRRGKNYLHRISHGEVHGGGIDRENILSHCQNHYPHCGRGHICTIGEKGGTDEMCHHHRQRKNLHFGETRLQPRHLPPGKRAL